MAGQYATVATGYAFPLVVYLHNRPCVLSSGTQGEAFFRCLHLSLVKAGIQRLDVRVTALDLPREGRRRCWIDWWGISGAGRRSIVLQTVCYGADHAEGLRIEMVEFTHLDVQLQLAA